MTILAPAPDTRQPADDLLTGFDVLDIGEALRNAAAADCTALTARDRQALAYLTYSDSVSPLMRKLVARIADGRAVLPLYYRTAALHLLVLADTLPPVSDADRDAWLAARDADTPCVVDQIIGALAGYAATRTGEDGAHLLHGAIQTAIRVGKPGIPLDEVPHVADAELVAARGDLDGLLYDPAQSPVNRALQILAAEAARHPGSSRGDTLRWAIACVAAEQAHASPTPIPDEETARAHQHAADLIDQARRQQIDAEYGQTAATR